MTAACLILSLVLFFKLVDNLAIRFNHNVCCFVNNPCNITTRVKNITLNDHVPIDKQFGDATGDGEEDSQTLEVTEDQFKAATASAVQLSTLGIDWIKAIEELKENDECTISTNTLAYNAAISSAAKNYDFDKAVALFKEMKQQDPGAVDVVTYKMLIFACELSHKYEEAIAFYNDSLASGIKPDYGLLALVLRCSSAVGYDEFAIKAFAEIKKVADPKVHDYNNVIMSCINSNNTNSAINHFEQLLKVATVKDLSTSLSYLILHGSFNMNMKLLDNILNVLVDKNVDIGKKSFIDLLQGLYNCREYEKMDLVWGKICDFYGEERGDIAYQIMLKRYAATGDCMLVMKLLKDMQKVYQEEMNELTFISAIESCVPSGEYRLAISFLRKGQSLGVHTSVKLLINVFKACEAGESWEDLALIYEQNKDIILESSGRDCLEAKIYYILANYHLNRLDKAKEVIGELSGLQQYSFPFAIKMQKFVQNKLSSM